MENLEILKSEKVIKVQNRIALDEFKRNYNKSESKRILDELDYRCPDADALQTELQSYFTEYTIKVSNLGTIAVWEEEKDSSLKCYRQILLQMPTLKMPYGYVMGGKVGKRNMQQFVDEHEWMTR